MKTIIKESNDTICEDVLLDCAGNKVKVHNFPFPPSSKKHNTYFMKLCELIEPKTNRLCLGLYEDGKRRPATEERIYMYIGAKRTSIRKIMHLMRKAGVIADFITRDGHTFVMNPMYVSHIEGTYQSVYDLFNIGDIKTYADKLKANKTRILRQVNEEIEAREKQEKQNK